MSTINALQANMNEEEELHELRRQAITDLINTRFGTRAHYIPARRVKS